MAGSRLFKPFLWLGHFLRGLRLLVLNLITLAVLVLLIATIVIATKPAPAVPVNAVLRLDLQGSLRNVRSKPSFTARILNDLTGPAKDGIVVRRLVTAIDRAAADPRIHLLDLNLSNFSGGTVTQLDQVARALQHFRTHGKPIYAFSPSYTQASYALAAQANQIYLPRLGFVLISGFTTKGLYFKGLLDKVGVNVYAFRQGKYKSAVEPLTRENMSQPARVENRAWLRVWWQHYRDLIAEGRDLHDEQVSRYVEHLPHLLQAAQGNAADLALRQGLITRIGDHHAMEEAIARVVHTQVGDVPSLSWRSYLAATKQSSPAKAQIAVVPIDGMLLPGNTETRGVVATGPTLAQLHQLLHDSAVKAVVLQMDSPGGDVNTANAIRRAIEKLRHAGKPVVVSMGTLGASGAYWLSTAANAIYAEPTTLTADIGVFVLIPNFSELLHKIGVGYSGISVPSSGTYLSSYAPLSQSDRKAFQALVDHIYGHFVGLVAKARHLPIPKVYHMAQGRAWSGEAAYHLGLITGLGGLQKGIQKAAQLAHLAVGRYQVRYLPRPSTNWPTHWVRQAALATLPEGMVSTSSLWGNPSILSQLRLIAAAARPYGVFSYLPADPVVH